MSEGASLIGRSTPRRESARFVAGRGRYTDDIAVANAGHVAFLRSPYPHARIGTIDVAAAKAASGVIAVVTAEDLAPVCAPWQTRLALVPFTCRRHSIRWRATRPAGRAKPWWRSSRRRARKPRTRLS